MACTMQYLEQRIKFCGTSTFREFIIWLNGNTSVNEKFYNNNLNNFSLQVSSGKSWKQYTLSSAGILCGECLCKRTYLSRKGRLWVVGIFCVSFHFFFVFFWCLLSSQDRGSLIRKNIWKWKKKSSVQGHFSHVVLFFLLPRFLNLSHFDYSR